jgi:glycosyltransferase involved in cell wall biosynthesis
MISFIVPAHNEQTCIGRTLQAIHESAVVVGQPCEIIVVDDASTDATAAIARQHNATVLSVNYRQISATRNAGAYAARGERLFFVDADTSITAGVVASALRSMDKGAAGGGALARFDGAVPLYAQLLLWWCGLFMRLAGITGGAFMFCTRGAFHAVGGFDERLFGGEDAAMALALKREGRFVVLWKRVLTSGRRMQGFRGPQMVAALFRMAFRPGMLRRRSSVDKVWYNSNREEGETIRASFAIHATNAILLLLTIALVTSPLWNLIPWSLTPLGSPLGEIRWGIAMFSCHVALVLWPCAYFLLRSLLRQKRRIEQIKLAALVALCLVFAWSGAREVIGFWIWVYDWLAHTAAIL